MTHRKTAIDQLIELHEGEFDLMSEIVNEHKGRLLEINELLKEEGEDLEHVHEQAQKYLPEYMRVLVEPYHLSTYWYEVVECVRKFVLVGLPVVYFEHGHVDQLYMGQCIALLLLGGFLVLRPCHDAGDNVLHTATDVQLYVTMMIGVVLKHYPVGSGQHETMDWALLIMTIFTTSLLLIEETACLYVELQLLLQNTWYYFSKYPLPYLKKIGYFLFLFPIYWLLTKLAGCVAGCWRKTKSGFWWLDEKYNGKEFDQQYKDILADWDKKTTAVSNALIKAGLKHDPKAHEAEMKRREKELKAKADLEALRPTPPRSGAEIAAAKEAAAKLVEEKLAHIKTRAQNHQMAHAVNEELRSRQKAEVAKAKKRTVIGARAGGMGIDIDNYSYSQLHAQAVLLLGQQDELKIADKRVASALAKLEAAVEKSVAVKSNSPEEPAVEKSVDRLSVSNIDPDSDKSKEGQKTTPGRATERTATNEQRRRLSQAASTNAIEKGLQAATGKAWFAAQSYDAQVREKEEAAYTSSPKALRASIVPKQSRLNFEEMRSNKRISVKAGGDLWAKGTDESVKLAAHVQADIHNSVKQDATLKLQQVWRSRQARKRFLAVIDEHVKASKLQAAVRGRRQRQMKDKMIAEIKEKEAYEKQKKAEVESDSTKVTGARTYGYWLPTLG